MYSFKNCEGPYRIYGLRSVTAKRHNIKKISDYLLFFDKIAIFAYRLTIKIYRIMKRSTRILLIAVTVLVCLICLSNAVYIIIQGGGMAGLYGVNMERAQWNQEVLGLQHFIFWGWLTAGLVFDALLAVFMIRSLLAVRSGILFPKANTFLLMAASAVNLIYNICHSNIGIVLHSERLFTIDNADLLLPLILLAFSLIYGIAVRISEENQLTI